jgi:hypothetical protein
MDSSALKSSFPAFDATIDPATELDPDTEHDTRKEPSGLDEETLYVVLRHWFEDDATHSAEWRKRAHEEYDFVAGEQWSPEDKRVLEEQRRPAIVFNRAIAIIKSVAGIEINGRHETTYLPRGNDVGAVKANELLNQASQWMSDGCDAEDEQSEAFQDAVICGMGFTEARLDFEQDPEGIYIEEKIDPLEMYWDKNARAKNLADAKRLWRVRKFALDEAMARFPDYPPEELDCTWARYAGQTEPTKSYEEKKFRNTEPKAGDFDRRTEVHIVQVQWWEREKYWRVADPRAARPVDLDEKQYQQLSRRAALLGMPIKAIQMTRRVYKQAFLGAQILDGVRVGPCEDRFTFNCITGEKDRNRGVWFGLVRLMRDPQMWANKWLSQTLHILNTTAKGGVLAEEDAFPDQREAEETYAQPDSITWVANGAISKGKITAKPGQGIPQAYQQLLEFAVNSIPAVTGLNPELLGQRDINQPGVLEQKRKEAAMTILAGLFDALRRFRKQVGRVRLFFIQEYLSDGRIIRIAGQEGFELVPLIREKTLGKYDVIIDDAPTSPNQKQETWALLVTILPMFAQMLTPEVVVMILEYSPLPSRLIESLKGLLQKAPDPVAQQTAQAQLAAIQAAVAQQQAQAAKDQATAQRTIAGIGLDQAKAHELMAKAATAGQGKGPTPPPAPTEKDAAETDRIRALTVLALAQAAGVAGDTAVSHAKRDLLASEIDAHMNTPLGGGMPHQAPMGGHMGQEPVGPLALTVLGQPHPGAPAVAPAMDGHMPPVSPLRGPQPLGGPLSGLSHLPPELLAHLAQLTGAGAPPPA